MCAKDKLKKFRENETFSCLYQPTTEEVFRRDHPLKGNWNSQVFKNDNPIVIELGCGKGEYTIALSQLYKEMNFIGVDIKGARIWKGAKYAHLNKLENVAFLRTRIEFIESLFAPGEIYQVWITFPDPQIKRPKKRLTSPLFLKRYYNFLAPDGIINLKTDSRFLYEYTLALVNQNNLPLIEANSDIYGTNRADAVLSIKTFYEAHYLKRGIPITYLSFKLNTNSIVVPDWDEEKFGQMELDERGGVPSNKG